MGPQSLRPESDRERGRALTGIPAGRMLEGERDSCCGMEDQFAQPCHGQKPSGQGVSKRGHAVRVLA